MERLRRGSVPAGPGSNLSHGVRLRAELQGAGRVEGAEDPYYASPVAAGGKLVTASHAGRVAVLEAGADWKVLAVRDLGEEIWATPAIGDGQVFVRTQQALYCFDSRVER